MTNAAADLLCGKGGDSRRQVAELTATPMLAWLWSQLQGQAAQRQPDGHTEADDADGANPSPLPAFFAWVARQQAAARLQFEVKGQDAGLALGDAAQLAAPTPAQSAAWSAEDEEEAGCEPAGALARAMHR